MAALTAAGSSMVEVWPAVRQDLVSGKLPAGLARASRGAAFRYISCTCGGGSWMSRFAYDRAVGCCDLGIVNAPPCASR